MHGQVESCRQGLRPQHPRVRRHVAWGKLGVNVLTFPEPQAVCAEAPRQSAFAAYAGLTACAILRQFDDDSIPTRELPTCERPLIYR